jgi:hypothetical protein
MDEFHKKAPAGWLESLDISERQAAAGDTVPYSEVKKGLQESIGRLETRKKTKKKPADT